MTMRLRLAATATALALAIAGCSDGSSGPAPTSEARSETTTALSPLGCPMEEDDAFEGVTITDPVCTRIAVAAEHCDRPAEDVTLETLDAATSFGSRSTLTFAGGTGGATLDLIVSEASGEISARLTCMGPDGRRTTDFSAAEWAGLQGSPSTPGTTTQSPPTTSAPATTTIAPAPTAAPEPGTPADPSILDDFNRLKAEACTTQPQASEIPAAVSAEHFDPGTFVVRDADGTSLIYAPDDRTVTALGGAQAQLPAAYTFGCDPAVFLGTWD